MTNDKPALNSSFRGKDLQFYYRFLEKVMRNIMLPNFYLLKNGILILLLQERQVPFSNSVQLIILQLFSNWLVPSAKPISSGLTHLIPSLHLFRTFGKICTGARKLG